MDGNRKKTGGYLSLEEAADLSRAILIIFEVNSILGIRNADPSPLIPDRVAIRTIRASHIHRIMLLQEIMFDYSIQVRFRMIPRDLKIERIMWLIWDLKRILDKYAGVNEDQSNKCNPA